MKKLSQIPIDNKNSQKGAVLIIVLLLVASLSAIAVGLNDQTLLASARLRNDISKTQALWRLRDTEIAAIYLLEQSLNQRPDVMSIDDIWVVQNFDLSILSTNTSETGDARFSDGSRCFNLNSLYLPREQENERSDTNDNSDTDSNNENQPTLSELRTDEFIAILATIGISNNEARQLTGVIRDWIDPDTEPQEGGGAEDNRYLSLPIPYRTGNNLLTSKTELRAMFGVDALLMRAVEPYVCALPTQDPVALNVNMLRERDAPLLVGVFGGRLSLNDALLLIERRPLGGYASIDAFLSQSILEGITPPAAERLAITSEYINAHINLQFGKTFLRSTMLLKKQDGNRLAPVTRRFGSEF